MRQIIQKVSNNSITDAKRRCLLLCDTEIMALTSFSGLCRRTVSLHCFKHKPALMRPSKYQPQHLSLAFLALLFLLLLWFSKICSAFWVIFTAVSVRPMDRETFEVA